MDLKTVANWIDERTGYRGMLRALLYEHIPGGARWRYVWGSTLMFCFSVQAITGIFLWMSYSPSSQTAWESVYYIQHEMSGGWLLRGIHHFTAQAMVVLLAIHMMQVIYDGAYKAPREVNFWIGLILLQIVLGLSLTGYLLPWDQKGYWATKVATSLAEAVPWVGPAVQKVVVGGHDYGHHTLTRFFALHAGVLPGAMVLMIVAHIYAFRRHGITAKLAPDRADSHFWPDQVLKDAVACLGVLVAVLFCVLYFGAPLGAPADPTEQYSAARPEWYFLFLFQLLKYFPGEQEIIGAVVVPGAIMGVFFMMPFVGKSKVGHAFNIAFIAMLLAGAGFLTVQALRQDGGNADYKLAVKQAEIDAHRSIELAQAPTGIPPTGAVTLVRDDPKTMGPRLFAANCASCHRYDGHDGLGKPIDAKPFAADLHGFTTKQWLTDFLDPKHAESHRFFAGTKFAKGKMVEFIKDDIAGYDDDEKKKLAELVNHFDAISNLRGHEATQITDANKALIEKAGKLMGDDGLSCLDCHKFYGEGGKSGPDLTGYRSHDWITKIIRDPELVGYRNKRDEQGKVIEDKVIYTMPAFHPNVESAQLDAKAVDLLARWLRGDWYEPVKPAEGVAGK